ncbi:NolF secretion protein [Ketogulonicigenium robustum]|uniref:NolF secretion protein n=1 Tax=Ketogulonicigenium robustum TaxID=92947 RepID=A0A1W6P037_9RHOB|nr:efflux RND transporter periplasmic adaptor subunit [Ketogulonicigenium robustum]ARO14771.1 NolF secretion protein [Ketogulonicigenium robustum]
MANTQGTESSAKPATTPTPAADMAKPEWAMSRREFENARRAREGLPPKRRKWPWIVLGIVVLAGGGAIVYQQRTAAADAQQAAAATQAVPADAPRLQVNAAENVVMAPTLLQRQVKVTGAVAPANSVAFSSEASGVVESVSVRVGDQVKAGDVLVQVNVEALTLQLNLARSNADATRVQLELAEAQLARVQELVGRGVSTNSTLDETRTNVEAQRANLSAMQDQIRSAELSLSKATLRAPFDGVVSERNTDPGAFVSIGSQLLTIVDMSRMEMQANAAVTDSVQLAVGQKATITVDGIAGRTFEGVVERISPVATTGSRTIPVSIMIDNADGFLRGGMFAIGQVVTQEEADALVLPVGAIRTEGGTNYVLVVVDDKVERRDVTLNTDWSREQVQVLTGLAAGDRVISLPLSGLAAGDLVTFVED